MTETSNTPTAVYTVAGMTCDHRLASVHEQVCVVADVAGVEIELETARLIVSGGVDVQAGAAAVREAGYEVVS